MRPEILNLDARVVFFPVRHHSPTAALLVERLIKNMKPAAVLIEGPSDFNERMDELFLGHKLPVAIYTYFRTEEMQRSAFYPFCDYSPEWVAAQTAKKLSAQVEFMDMPWRQMAAVTTRQHRYADGELRENRFIPTVCKKLGLESFDELWDEFIESQQSLDLQEYMKRCHHLCYQMRHSQPVVDDDDIVRERFMADHIKRVMDKVKGRVLVIAGGFHCHALYERINGLLDPTEDITAGNGTAQAQDSANAQDTEDAQDPADAQGTADTQGPAKAPMPADIDKCEWGIALTPYSYQRLDSLTGYDAGMPSPGFYHQIFTDRQNGGDSTQTYRKLLFSAATALRGRKQQISSADLIAVEISAQALARLRGHENVWRSDLIDGIMSALVKDEITSGVEHPMLTAIHDALRGEASGKLAAGTTLPPLLHYVLAIGTRYGLNVEQRWSRETEMVLDLLDSGDLERSQELHRLAWLGIAGFNLTSVSQLTGDEKGKVEETWVCRWQTDMIYASCIEAAMYGATTMEAAATKLVERVREPQVNSQFAAILLAEASYMGISELSDELVDRCQSMIRRDQEFLSVTECVQQLLFLYKYDQILADKPVEQLGTLVYAAFDRAVWLLDTLGTSSGNEMSAVTGIGSLVDVYQQCAGGDEPLQTEYFIEVLTRARADTTQTPIIRGAVTGALWSLGHAELATIENDVSLFRQPEHIGDFLTGLFHRARQILQTKPELMTSLDNILMSFNEEQFLEAIPSMRQAFAYFSPREKHYLATAILKGSGAAPNSAPLTALSVDVGTAERAMAIEARAQKQIRRFGIRSFSNE